MQTVLDALSQLSPESVLDAVARLSPESLLEDPRRVQSPVYLVLLGVFAAVLLLGLTLAIGSRRLSGGNRLHQRVMQRYGAWAAWLGGFGLVAIGLRYAAVPLLSKRLWSVLDVLAIMGVAAHFVWYRIRGYPREIAEYREEQRRRRFLALRRPSRPVRRPQRRGRRARS